MIRGVNVRIAQASISNVLANVVLLIIDEVPSIDEVMTEVLHTVAVQRDGNVRPAHARALRAIELVLERLGDIAEIHNSSIVVVLSWEDCQVQIGGVCIRNRMLVGIPSTEAQIQASHKRKTAIHK